MASILEVCIYTAYWWRRHIAMAVGGRSVRRGWRWNNSSTRRGVANQISCDKNITNRNRAQM